VSGVISGVARQIVNPLGNLVMTPDGARHLPAFRQGLQVAFRKMVSTLQAHHALQVAGAGRWRRGFKKRDDLWSVGGSSPEHIRPGRLPRWFP
jgi:hypothetical protein